MITQELVKDVIHYDPIAGHSLGQLEIENTANQIHHGKNGTLGGLVIRLAEQRVRRMGSHTDEQDLYTGTFIFIGQLGYIPMGNGQTKQTI